VILAVAKNRLMNLRRDRAAFVLAFILPVAFFTIFAAIFAGSSRSTTRKIAVIVVDEDGSELSRAFVAGLKADAGLSVGMKPGPEDDPSGPYYGAATAEQAVKKGEVSVALIVPKGFGAAAGRAGVTILADSSDPVAPQILRGLVQKVALGLPGAAAAREAMLPISTRDVVGETKRNPTVTFYAAGLGVMFLLFSAAGAGGALIEEAESGTLDRILSTNVSMTPLLLGKLVYLTGVGIAQLTLMFVWGALAFGLDLAHHVPGFVVMTVSTALATSTFGLVLASVSRSRMQLVAISNLVILIMSALGGSLFPRFLMPAKIQKIGLVTLNAWALDGFQKIFWRDEPLVSIWPQVLVLLGLSTVLFVAARRIARRWEFS
jgi:ABC-2 type transport system permease protein